MGAYWMQRKMSNLTLRLITAFIAGPLFLLGMWAGPLGRELLLGWMLLAGAGEWERLVAARFKDVGGLSRYFAWIFSLGYSVLWVLEAQAPLFLAWTALALLLWVMEAFRKLDIERLFPWLSMQLFGTAFLGLWAGQAFSLMHGTQTMSFEPVKPFLFVLFCMWVVDTGAYIFGRSMGKHKLAPELSPKKTWEGAVGGTALTLLFAAYTGPALLNIGLGTSLLLGLLLAVAAQLGDLLESALKRWAGIKDSSNLLPGHGGFLDRFDGFYFSAPMAALVLQLTTMGYL